MAATVVARGNVSGLENKDFEMLAVPLLDGLYNFARWLSATPMRPATWCRKRL